MADNLQQSNGLSAFSDALAEIVERMGRSLVTVAARPRQSATGILWQVANETVVVTADHVVEREDDIVLGLPDGREVKGQLVGRDPGTDLAVIRLSGVELGEGAHAAQAGALPTAGSLVLAIGRPSASGPRVSFGAVSYVDGPRRTWHGGEIERIIFADVTLYPGFSGGPLVDLAGKVVGLNSSHLTRQSSTAIPAATVERVVQSLHTHGRMRRGYLGVGTQQVPLPAALAQKVGVSQESALLVATVEPGSPAERAGLLIGDLLVSLNGQGLPDVGALRAALRTETLGQSVTIKIVRGGEPQDVQATITERQ